MNENENNVPMSVPAIADDNIIAIAEAADRRIQAITKIKQIALKVTNASDWTHQGGKPYLQVSGSEKVGRTFGVSWRIDPPMWEVDEDGHFNYTFKGYFSLGAAEIEAIGTRSSRDPFFSTGKGGVAKPPSEIDRGDVKKAAYTNCLGNGISRLLGLRNMTWDDLATAGITPDKVAGIDYKKPEMSDEAKNLKAEIQSMILEMANGDQEAAKGVLEKFTEFPGRDGQIVAGKRSITQISEKQAPVTHKKVKAAYDQWKGAGGNGGNASGADSAAS
jgi:hypothetical protein